MFKRWYLNLMLTVCIIYTSPIQALDFFTIGTGAVTGTYYPTGGTICRFVNKKKAETKLHCSLEATGGSVYNINSLMSGNLDLAIAQSDVIYQAHNGIGRYADNPFPDLRAVMAIYPELLALVVNQAAGIEKLQDIHDKRINIGNPGSGNEATAKILLEEANIKLEDLALAEKLTATECPRALQDKKIDGYFYMVGHPTANIREAANLVDIDILPLAGEMVDSMIKKYPYFSKGIIPGEVYNGIEEEVPSFGVKAVLITHVNESDNVVKIILESVVNNFEAFKRLHPSYQTITKESLVEGVSAPLHPAAEAFFEKEGLL